VNYPFKSLVIIHFEEKSSLNILRKASFCVTPKTSNMMASRWWKHCYSFKMEIIYKDWDQKRVESAVKQSPHAPSPYLKGLGPQVQTKNHIFMALSCWEHEDSVLTQTQPSSGLALDSNSNELVLTTSPPEILSSP